MGFPMIQVFMIAARQVSKPVADAVLKYGKSHPTFRNRILIPIGRGISRLTTRLRMRNLGLGAPTAPVQVSEAAALEQASDFVQQTVLFSYSLGVFCAYYFYTQWSAPESIKAEEFHKIKREHSEAIADLQERLRSLEELLKNNVSVTGQISSQCSSTSDSGEAENSRTFARVSSLPIDDAANVVLTGYEEFLVVRSGTSIGIEEAAAFRERGEPLRFRKKEFLYELPMPGVIGVAERFALSILGRWSG